MASDFGVSGWVAQAQSIAKGVYDAGIWIILIALLLFMAWLIWYLMSFKHFVVVRLQTKNGKRVRICKSKSVVVNGVPMWSIRGMKKVSPPPADAIETTKKGALWAECYWSEDNPEPVWLKDTEKGATAFQPFVTQERSLHVEGLTKAVLRRKKNFWEVLSQIAMPIALLIIVVIIFAFWGEMTAPQVEISKSQALASSEMARVSEMQARMLGVMTGQLSPDQLNVSQSFGK
jgi:hypothetical protein